MRCCAFMPASTRYSFALFHCVRTIHKVLVDLCRLLVLTARSHNSPAAASATLQEFTMPPPSRSVRVVEWRQ